MDTIHLITLGADSDLCCGLIGAKADEMGIPHIHCNETDYGKTWKASSGRESIMIHIGNMNIPAAHTIIFPRYSPTPQFDGSDDSLLKGAAIRERRSSIHYFCSISKGAVINRPHRGLTNCSKPLQMTQLARAGFSVPDWVVSNDPSAMADFMAVYKDGIIYKSISGLRSRVRKLTTNKEKEFDWLTCPVLLQKWIRGFDVRVHTVGNVSFGTKICGSDDVDYRWSKARPKYERIPVPGRLHKLMVDFANDQGLSVAGFDFKVGPDNQWYCLEMNPAPTFAVYEIATHQPISEAIIKTGIEICKKNEL